MRLPFFVKTISVILIVAGSLVLIPMGLSLFNKEASAKNVVKTKGNLQFDVPEDWPIEERNGAVGPIPIEEYLALKFDDVNSQISALSQQVSLLDARLSKVEGELRPKKKLILKTPKTETVL